MPNFFEHLHADFLYPAFARSTYIYAHSRSIPSCCHHSGAAYPILLSASAHPVDVLATCSWCTDLVPALHSLVMGISLLCCVHFGPKRHFPLLVLLCLDPCDCPCLSPFLPSRLRRPLRSLPSVEGGFGVGFALCGGTLPGVSAFDAAVFASSFGSSCFAPLFSSE